MTDVRTSGGNGASVVGIGSAVRIRGADGGEQELTVVGTVEEQSLHRLPIRTPLGGALVGRCVGEEAEVRTDAGTVKFTIVAIRDAG
jgi:transcription elongation GreA/GreB family factor